VAAARGPDEEVPRPAPRRPGRLQRALPLLGFALLSYGPLLLTAPGVVVADTKTYLYLDPARLLSRAVSLWDPHVALGTVTHQNIGYLWPMGPWFWLMERLGLPDWVAQRLWLGSIIFLAGLGVRYLLRTFGWRGPAVAVAMVAYAFTPYLLTLAARLSVILLPFAALPWLLGLTVRAVRAGGWRHPALIALVVVTAGSVNATAIVLAAVAPALWLVWAVIGSREASAGTAARTAVRIVVLSLAVNLWWIAGLSIQATHGLEVLRYSETAEVVASGSLAHEILRGLGYWFFYGDDRLGQWIEPSIAYTQQLWLLGVTYLLPAVALLGGAVSRWRHRAFFVLLLLVGLVLAVGAYPFDAPPPIAWLIKTFLLTDVGLAMRSLPRAAPLVVLALAVMLGAGMMALVRRRPAAAGPFTLVLVALVVAALPPLWQRGMVPGNLRRPEAVPSYWREAAAYLDETDDGTRVFEIPGADFASYRWGNTVEPVTPGLTDRPLVFRELIPYGSPPSADLLVAFDGRLQAHVGEPASLVPIARLLRAGQVLVRSDLQFERYNTPRPRELWRLVGRAGLGEPVAFGDDDPNLASVIAPLQDELALSSDNALADPPAVAVLAVDGALPIVAAQPSLAPVVVAGDGAGLVDAAAAGLIDGNELILYSAAIDDDQLAAALERGAGLIVTDTNRRQGERWGSVRYNRGYTEPAGLEPLAADLSDNRLPVFPDAGDDGYTVAQHRGGVAVNATAYGNPVEYSPDDRPALAVDGDPTTAWRTGAFSSVLGDRLVLTYDDPVTVGELTLLQPITGHVNRWITEVRLRFDDDDTLDVRLGEESRAEPGQVVDFPERTFRTLEIEIVDDTAAGQYRFRGTSSTGFAEVTVGDVRVDEVIRPPVDLLEAAGEASVDHPLAVVLTRQRSAPTEVVRTDEERAIVRSLEMPGRREFSLTGTARLSPRVADQVLDLLLGVPAPSAAGGVTVTSSSRMAGLPALRPSVAVDGDPATVWSPSFGTQAGQWIDIATGLPLAVDRITLTVVTDGRHSVPTAVGVEVDGERVQTLEVPPIADRDSPNATSTVELALDRPVRSNHLRFVIDAVREVTSIDWYGRQPSVMPVGIADIAIPHLTVRPRRDVVDTGCRTDLVTLDGEAIPIAVRGTVADAVAGEPLAVTLCQATRVALPEGEAVLRAAPGNRTGIDLDRLVLRSAAGGSASLATGSIRDEAVGSLPSAAATGADDVPRLAVADQSASRLTVDVTGASPGQPFWLSFGESHSPGWRARLEGRDLGEPVLVDGFANGWLIDPTQETFTLDLRFAPQRRVTVALWISALALVLCLLLAFTRLGAPARRATPLTGDLPAPLSGDVLHYPGRRPDKRVAIRAALILGVFATAVVHPLVGAAVGVAAYVALRRRGERRALTLAIPAAMLAAGLYVVAVQLVFEIEPGFEWPSVFAGAHLLGWLAVLLLVTDAVVARLWRGPRPPEPPTFLSR
jgi:arabinofuranan 3-O-arabinosyltransferase